MFEIRTDLALEAHEIAAKNKKCAPDGVIFRETSVDNYKMTRVEILSPEGEKATGKPMGRYLSLDVGKIWNRGTDEAECICTHLGNMLRELAGEVESVLVIGLGNTDITADALGPLAVNHLIVTRHLKTEAPDIFNGMGFCDLSAIAPGVLSQTGIETAETAKSICDSLKPSLVIAIDALASGDMSRLGTVVQISDTGISPGSGVCNRRSSLNRDTLGVPVISMGVPTVVDAVTLASNVLGRDITEEPKLHECENMFVTPKDCDKIIAFMSRVIGYAINMAFHKELNFEDITSVLS